MNSKDIQRYIALDIHKEYVMLGAMNSAQEWVIKPKRVEMMHFRSWAAGHLHTGDAVVIEATTNVWDIYDIVSPLVSQTVVAHAGAVRQIAEARVKTDTEDIKRLLCLLIAKIVPEVWVPPVHVRELRWAMIEAAWRAVRSSPVWEKRFQELAKRRGQHKAIVAIARRLLVVLWHLLIKQETDRNASQEDLEWKMLLWSWSLNQEARLGLTPKQFAKFSLIRLGVQSDITEFMRGKVLRRIAPAKEVLARISELGLPRLDT